jgi:hypothetical protein
MKKLVLVGLCLGIAAPVLAADAVPREVKAYVDRRKACNYWPSEQASRKREPLRRAEIDRHVRELNCPTLDREEAVLSARYQDKPDIMTAIADAHDAMPD